MRIEASIEVVEPGPLTTVQDRGRMGWAHLGVPRGGVLDRGAAALALRLVGGAPDDALLETTMGGVVVRTRRAVTFAVTGARCEVRVGSRSVGHAEPVTAPAGSVVAVGRAMSGVRSYLAFAGGLAVPLVLGSRSTDTLSWVGPPRLAAGQVLALGVPHRLPRAPGAVVVRQRQRELHLVRGPRADWVDAAAWAALDGASYAVAPDSDRIGLRLSGPVVARRSGGVQLPPSGQPLVFLADHPTTGGYPVVALVTDRDLDLCAQLRPGDVVRMLLG